MEEDETDRRNISVEAKTFSYHISKKIFHLLESHKSGVKEISLSPTQARWIAEGLNDTSSVFGHTRRKETKTIAGRSMALIKGSNNRFFFYLNPP